MESVIINDLTRLTWPTNAVSLSHHHCCCYYSFHIFQLLLAPLTLGVINECTVQPAARLCHTGFCLLSNMTSDIGHQKSLISVSVLHIWLFKVSTVCVPATVSVRFSIPTILSFSQLHTHRLSPPHSHTLNSHIFACTHPTPTQRKYVGYKSKLYPVWALYWWLWQLNRQGNYCIFLHIKLVTVI